MANRSSALDWIETADDYFGEGKNREFDFVIFLLGKNDKIYPELKKHSLCTSGYVSQVVKARSMQKKGVLSVCSKILLQLNAKLRGVSYKVNFSNTITERKFMVIGVETSRIRQGKKTGVAMVATINDSFTEFKDLSLGQNHVCVASSLSASKHNIKIYKTTQASNNLMEVISLTAGENAVIEKPAPKDKDNRHRNNVHKQTQGNEINSAHRHTPPHT